MGFSLGVGREVTKESLPARPFCAPKLRPDHQIWSALPSRAPCGSHALNPTILDKYEQVDWIFAVYDGIALTAVYRLTPADLAPYFDRWRKKWHDEGGKDINNPKIRLGFVERVGKKLHPAEQTGGE